MSTQHCYESFESEVKAYCDAFGWEMPTFDNENTNNDLRKLEGGAFYLGVRRYKELFENN